jgi:sugar lactone lactonase YvrE
LEQERSEDVTDGKNAVSQSIGQPAGLAMDAAGNLYVSDRGNNKIYKIDASGIVTKFAGTGDGRFSGDGRPAIYALLNGNRGLDIDASGALYVADTGNNRIRKIQNGIITTVAGGGVPCANDSATGCTPPPDGTSYPLTGSYLGDGLGGTLASLNKPEGVVVDTTGRVFIADTGNNRIRMLSRGLISTVAGRDLTNAEKALDANGDPIQDPAKIGATLKGVSAPYPATCAKPKPGAAPCAPVGDGRDPLSALLASPSQLALDTSNNLLIADRDNHRVRILNPNAGTIFTLAGNEKSCAMGQSNMCGDGAAAKLAQLNSPNGIFVDSRGRILIADRGNNRVRTINSAGVMQSVTGFNPFNGDQTALTTMLSVPIGVASDAAGNIYVTDSGNARVRMIDIHGNVTTLAGGGYDSVSEGIAATSAKLSNPTGIAVDPAGLAVYVVDTGTDRIRKIVGGLITTIAGGGSFTTDGLPGTTLSLSLNSRGKTSGTNNTQKFSGLALDSNGVLYFSEPGNSVIRKILPDGTVTTVAGTYGESGAAGDGGPALQAFLNNPTGLAVDAGGQNLYFADTNNHVVRVISSGVIYPLAGEMGQTGDDNEKTTPAYTFRYRYPQGVALDPAGTALYVNDTAENRANKIPLSTLVAARTYGNRSNTNGDFAFNFSDNADPAKAQVSYPMGLTVDAKGNVYFADSANNLIRLFTPGK